MCFGLHAGSQLFAQLDPLDQLDLHVARARCDADHVTLVEPLRLCDHGVLTTRIKRRMREREPAVAPRRRVGAGAQRGVAASQSESLAAFVAEAERRGAHPRFWPEQHVRRR